MKTIIGAKPDTDVVCISRAAFMEILTSNLKEAGIDMTVRRYNKILTDLGFRLDEKV